MLPNTFVILTLSILKFVRGQFTEESLYETCSNKNNTSPAVLCFGMKIRSAYDCIPSKDCEILVSIFEDPRHKGKVRFQLLGKKSKITYPGAHNGEYVAVGLSNDDIMGYDSVVECVASAGKVPKIFASWNVERLQNERQKDKSYISNEWATNKDNSILCDFTRDAESEVRGVKFNLKRFEYFLMLAAGPAQDEVLENHIDYRIASRGSILNSKSIVLHEPKKFSTASIYSISFNLLLLTSTFLFLNRIY